MAAVVKVEGAKKLALLGLAVRRMGTDRVIVNRLAYRIRQLGPAIRQEIRDSAIRTLPRAGGLGVWVSKSRVNVSVTRGAKTAGVRIVAGRNSANNKRSDVKRIDAGSTRHPLWGNRKHWYPQAVRPGFATRVIEGPVGDAFQAETINAIDDAIAEVLRGL